MTRSVLLFLLVLSDRVHFQREDFPFIPAQ
jgi:hypothetical protein